MLKIHGLLQKDTLPDSATLAQQLESSAKTIFRDVAFMRDRLGLPITYDAANRAYRYSEHVESFPLVGVSEGEVFALMVAQKVLQGYRGTPFFRMLEGIFKKLTAALSDRIAFSPAIADAISFGSFGAAAIRPEVYTAVLQGLLHSQGLLLRYRKPATGTWESRRVEPYHLANREGMWYLIANDPMRKGLRIFALSRVAEAVVDGQPFKRAEDFDPHAVLPDTRRAYVGGKERIAVVRFSSDAAYGVEERVWHPDQKLKPLRGGGVELQIPFNNSIELERWVMSWGSFAELVRPLDIRRELRSITASMAATYH